LKFCEDLPNLKKKPLFLISLSFDSSNQLPTIKLLELSGVQIGDSEVKTTWRIFHIAFEGDLFLWQIFTILL
jgi:hypothetical protein